MHALGAIVVSLFAIVFMHGARLLRLVNPVFGRYLRAGLPGGPNALLEVRGRSSGRWYRAPVAMLQVGDRHFVQAAFGEVGWVRNLRATGHARVTQGRYSVNVEAVELGPETAGALMAEALAPYPRSRLLRRVVGPATRPPVGVLHYFGVRIDDALADYVAQARGHPLFELLAVPQPGATSLIE